LITLINTSILRTIIIQDLNPFQNGSSISTVTQKWVYDIFTIDI